MIDPAFGHWLAGFTDGEGAFVIRESNGTYPCMFEIGLRRDDTSILETIQQTLGIGRINFSHQRDTILRPNANPKAQFRVQSKRDCIILRDVFNMYPLRAKKAQDFVIWSAAVDFWVQHKLGDSWENIISLREQLRFIRTYKEECERVAQLSAQG